ncbi:MAG: glycosyltransferase 87 family protein [Frankiaceae bacterium]
MSRPGPTALERPAATAQPPAPAAPPRSALAVALLPWVVSRALAGVALAVVALTHDHLPAAGNAPHPTGLFAWDGAWYRHLAVDGYRATEDWRFFPLVPMLGRLLAPALGGSVDAALLVVCNVAALGYLALLVRLVRTELGEGPWVARSAWLACLAPGASALALPYTEAVAGLLAVGFFLALRARRPGLAAAAGFLCGLARPTGLLLAVPALVVAARARRRSPRLALAALGAAAAPVLGTALFCAGAWYRTGRPLLPYTAQTHHGLRGGVVRNPFLAPFSSHPFGLPWPATVAFLVAAVALVAVALHRLPLPYGLWSAAVVFLAVSSSDDHSLPRYLSAAFPLLMAAALWARDRRRWAAVAASSAAGFVALAVLGLTAGYIP